MTTRVDEYICEPVQRVPPIEAVYCRGVYIGEITYRSRAVRGKAFLKEWGWRPLKATRATLGTREEAVVQLRQAWERRFGPVPTPTPSG